MKGKKHGHGIWKKSDAKDSNTYTGEYEDDMKSGMGEFRWATGGYYKGQYSKDLKAGFGEMTWADGSTYSGLWA